MWQLLRLCVSKIHTSIVQKAESATLEPGFAFARRAFATRERNCSTLTLPSLVRVQCTIAGAGALPLPVCHIRATRPAEATYKQNPLCDNMPAVFATCPTSTSDTVCALQPGNPATNVPTLAIRAIVYLCNVSARAMYAAQSVVEKTRLVTPTLLSRDDFTDRMYVASQQLLLCAVLLCCAAAAGSAVRCNACLLEQCAAVPVDAAAT